MEQWITEVYQNRPHSGLAPREHPGRSFSPNQMYAASFDATAGIALPITENEYIGFLHHVERTIRADGIHLNKEIYDSEGLNGLRGTKQKHEVRYDKYEPDRVWVLHPESGEWIECAARSVRLLTLPFGGTISANLAAMAPADDPTDRWSQDFLSAERERAKRDKKKPAAKRASKKAIKTAAEMASRKNDDMPRPGPMTPAPLPPAAPLRDHPDDYQFA